MPTQIPIPPTCKERKKTKADLGSAMYHTFQMEQQSFSFHIRIKLWYRAAPIDMGFFQLSYPFFMSNGYHAALSPAHSELLFAVWRWETEPAAHPRRITSSDLSNILGWSRARVQSVVREIRKISGTKNPSTGGWVYGLEIYHQHTQSGRPLDSFLLNQNEIVTFPETAFMLLQLTTFPFAPDQPFRVNRKAFEEHMQKSGMSESLVTDRIQTNIRVGYIHEYELPAGYIFYSGKVERDRSFIERLAKEFKPLGKTA